MFLRFREIGSQVASHRGFSSLNAGVNGGFWHTLPHHNGILIMPKSAKSQILQ